MKPVRIDSKEFGEIYHIAAYLAANEKHEAVVIGENDLSCYSDFLNNVSSGSTKIVKKNPGTIGPGETANYFESEKFNYIDKRVSDVLMPLLLNVTSKAKECLAGFSNMEKSCLLWVRNGKYEPWRNLTGVAFHQLVQVVKDSGYNPIVIGNESHFAPKIKGENLIEYYQDPYFKRNPLNQLIFLNHLCECANVHFSIGMKSGGMDGLAFSRGLKTIYFGRSENNERMNKVGSAFPSFVFIPVHYKKFFTCFSKHELESIYKIINTLTPHE